MMKRTLPFLACLLSLSIAVLFTFGGYLQNANTVSLPIEVIGEDNHTESITVSASDVSGVDRVWFLGYSVSHPKHFLESESGRYDEPKAEVRLNGGPWVGITNENVTCNDPEESEFNCVEGPYHTTRFFIPTSKLGAPTSGQNTLEFRFNYTPQDLSSGYYILGLSFLQSGESLPDYTGWKNSGAIDGTTWQYDNPGSWAPPSGYDNSSDIAAGRELWNQRNVLSDYPGGPSITASCADCHAADGQDLEYFSFSNKSIVTRAEFHDLSETQGKQIAAYIRSQSHPRVSWPWQPPYQPGPDISSHDPDCADMHPDKAPQKCWSAGAGLEWVLDKDTETADYLFPNGAGGQAGLNVASTQSTLNLRTVPIGMMYPDWNEWLPRTHPLDSDAFGDEFRSSNLWATYENGSLHDAKSDPQSLHSAISNWYEDRYVFAVDLIRKNEDPADEKMGYRQWGAVKLWEIMRGVEDYAPEVYDYGETRSWLGPDATIFDVAPHIHRGRVYGPDRTLYDTYLDTAWYDLAMLLNPGNRGGEHVLFPIDWRYHLGHIQEYANHGRPEPLRFARSYLKQNQMLDQGDTPASASDRGLSDWFWRYTSHRWLFDVVGRETSKTPIAFAPEPLQTNLYETLFRAYMQRILRVPKDDWRRGYDEPDLEPASHVPDPNQTVIGVTDYAEHFYRGIPWLRESGVRSSLIDSAATWAAAMWPKGNDPSVMGDNPTWDEMNPCTGSTVPDDCSGATRTISVSLTTPSDGATYDAPTDLSLTADASNTDGSIQRVTFYAGTTQIGEASSSPYTVTWTDVPSGTHQIKATAIGDGGQQKTSSTVEVTVVSGTSPETGVSYSYFEGDWQQLPNFGSLEAIATGTTSTFSTTVAEREDRFALRFVGYVNIPTTATGTYTFYTTSDDGSRLLIDGAEVVANDGVHGPGEKSGSTTLSSGWHKIVVEFFEQSGGQTLVASWEGPSIPKQEIPSSRLFLAPSRSTSQKIPLSPGWNVISSRIMPAPASLDSVFSEVSVAQVKNEQGEVFAPSSSLNEIGDWKSTDGYKVYTDTEQTLTLTGSPIGDTTGIPLDKGWNLIPYLPDNAQPIAEALQSISSALVIVKDEAGNAYVPAYGIDEIGQLEPGKGYQVYVDAPTEIVYNSTSSSGTTASVTRPTEDPTGQ